MPGVKLRIRASPAVGACEAPRRPGRATLFIPLFVALGGCAVERGDEHGHAQAPEGACSVLAGQTIRWIVPFSAGGGYDVYSRLLEPFYEEALGATIVVENRTGAGGRVGARMLRDAVPDGRTLGLVNAYSLLVMRLAEGVTDLHPMEDFTVLGRIGVGDPVWVTTPASGLRAIDDLLRDGRTSPIVFGLNGISGTGFVAASVTADLLRLDAAYLVGYPGTREASLGLIRGEFDVGAFTFESIRDRVETGELIPLLRVSDAVSDDHRALEGVPVLSGTSGLVARVARERGAEPDRSTARANALARLFEAGRLVVAPPGLPPELASCLTERLERVVHEPGFATAARQARRSLAWAHPEELAAQLEATAEEREALAAVLRRHAELARSGASVR